VCWQSLAVLASEGGNVEEARLWFRKGTQAMAFISRTSAPLWQAWALMEAKQGNAEEARRLFSVGLKQNPKNR
jgi:tetratricopeptide (TPR) repeat protein